MTLNDKIKEILEEGLSPEAMTTHGGSYMFLGTLLALPLYLCAGITNEQEAYQLCLFGGHLAGIHALIGASLYGIGKYRKKSIWE